MDAKLIGGKALGLPAYGAVVNIASADVAHLAAATAGLVRTLVMIAGGTIGLVAGIVGVWAYVASRPTPKIPVASSLVSVKTRRRQFQGFCLSETISFVCEGQTLTIPVTVLNQVRANTSLFGGSYYEIELVDGSVYKAPRDISPLDFASIAGVQKVVPVRLRGNAIDHAFKVSGASPSETETLREDLKRSLASQANDMLEVLGDAELFERFFQLEALRS